jgi:hypothetical protein
VLRHPSRGALARSGGRFRGERARAEPPVSPALAAGRRCRHCRQAVTTPPRTRARLRGHSVMFRTRRRDDGLTTERRRDMPRLARTEASARRGSWTRRWAS